MGAVSSVFGISASKSAAVGGWKLYIDPVVAKAEYTSDLTLDQRCTLKELEFRVFLAEPRARLFLEKFTEGNSDLTCLLSLWYGCRGVFRAHHRRKGVVLSNALEKFNRLNKSASSFAWLVSDISDEFIRLVSQPNADMPEIARNITIKLLRHCFLHLYEKVYKPFSATNGYRALCALMSNPDHFVSPNSFEYLDVIAKGTAGLVVLCRKTSTGTEYAMKIQRKKKMLQLRSKHDSVMTELQVLSLTKHPYITNLAYATQSASLVMLVLPLYLCGDLDHSLACNNGSFPVNRVQLHAAEVLSALFYMHKLGLVYRDLKPANVLLGADGHIALSDFGSVADLNGCLSAQSGRLFTGCVCVPCDISSSADNSSAGSWRGSFRGRSSSISAGRRNSGSGSARAVCPEKSVDHAHAEQNTTTISAPIPTQLPVAVATAAPSVPPEDPISAGTAPPVSLTMDASYERTKSLVGTVGYMAPEIVIMFGRRVIHKDGYTAAVDWWSLGVFIYRLLVGVEPFEHVCHKHLPVTIPGLWTASVTYVDVFSSIFGHVDYRKPGMTASAECLVRGLLQLVPHERTGCMDMVGDGPANECALRGHPFFHGIDWSAVENKSIQPSFDVTHECTIAKYGSHGIGSTATGTLSNSRQGSNQHNDNSNSWTKRNRTSGPATIGQVPSLNQFLSSHGRNEYIDTADRTQQAVSRGASTARGSIRLGLIATASVGVAGATTTISSNNSNSGSSSSSSSGTAGGSFSLSGSGSGPINAPQQHAGPALPRPSAWESNSIDSISSQRSRSRSRSGSGSGSGSGAGGNSQHMPGGSTEPNTLTGIGTGIGRTTGGGGGGSSSARCGSFASSVGAGAGAIAPAHQQHFAEWFYVAPELLEQQL